MKSKALWISIAVWCSLSSTHASAQQSIADTVAQLKSDLASLQRNAPGVSANTAPSFTLKNVEFTPGKAFFKSEAGATTIDIGSSTTGGGGLWIYNGDRKAIFDFTAAADQHYGDLKLSNGAGQETVEIQAGRSIGAGSASFFSANGNLQASVGAAAEGGGAGWFYDKTGKLIASLGMTTLGTGGLDLFNTNHSKIATLATGGNGEGGELYVYNSEGELIVTVGNNTSGGGGAHFYNAAGKEVAAIGPLGTDDTHGTVWIAGQDYAENFEAAPRTSNSLLQPGSVVSAAEEGDGIVLAARPYDPKVVGVLSGAGGLHPAMVAGKDLETALPPVAIAGQVYVRVSTENGSVRVGDLLVASGAPGVAMRASSPDKAIGSTIGKALQTYDAPGEGSIRMLVMTR